MNMLQKKLEQGADILIKKCGLASPKDTILIITDTQTKNLEPYLIKAALNISQSVHVLSTKTVLNHGHEPEKFVAEKMKNSTLILGLTTYSMAHTNARKQATDNGARYLSLPDYDINQLASNALTIDYAKQAIIAKKIKDLLDFHKTITITTTKGTNLSLSIKQRKANCCPGFCDKPGTLGSPPDIETNIAPHEHKSDGILVVDGSIPCKKIGLLKQDIILEVKNGMIHNIIQNSHQSKTLKNIFNNNANKAKILAEFGIGLNPQAQLCGRMLEDEGCLGTIHCGFGSNATIGGTNAIPFHLDFVIKKATVLLDNHTLLKNGTLTI